MAYHFGLEVSFAVVVSALIFTLIKIVKMKYEGALVITHLTSRPYLIAVLLYVSSLLELISYLFATNIIGHNDFAKVTDFILNSTVFK